MSVVYGITNTSQKNNYTINTEANVGTNNVKFSSFLGESKSLDAIFKEASKKYNVPVNLLKAIGKTESDFRADAVSRSGAQGIMQLMPATAKYLGVTDSFDAEQNIMGGTKYIKELLDKYNGDTKLALAAYNAGMNNVSKYGGIPPFEETQNYVKKIMNYLKDEGNIGVTNTLSSNYRASSVPKSSIQDNAVIINDLQDMDMVYTYDDYLKFLEIFLKDQKERDAKEDSNTYLSKALNYNAPVLNLINNM